MIWKLLGVLVLLAVLLGAAAYMMTQGTAIGPLAS
jgi:hypothetical protein